MTKQQIYFTEEEMKNRKELIAELEKLHREQRGWQRLVNDEVLDYDVIVKIPTIELEEIIRGLKENKK